MTIHAPLDDLAPQPSVAQSVFAAAPASDPIVWPSERVLGAKIWVGWHSVPREGQLPLKMPDSIPGGSPTTVKNLLAADCRSAYEVAKAHGDNGGYGLVLGTPLSDGTIPFGIDLDSCIQDGTTAPWAQQAINRFGTYAEVSPSGTGIKLFGLIDPETLPAVQDLIARSRKSKSGSRNARKWAWKTDGEHPPAIEIFLSGRWFAFTGRHLLGTPAEFQVVDFAAFADIIEKIGPALEASDPSRQSASAEVGSDPSIALPKVERQGLGLDRSLLPEDVRKRVADAEKRFEPFRKALDGAFNTEDPSGSAVKASLICLAKLAGLPEEDVKLLTEIHPQTAASAAKEGQRGFNNVWDDAEGPQEAAAAVAGIKALPPPPHEANGADTAAEYVQFASPITDAEFDRPPPPIPRIGFGFVRRVVNGMVAPGGVGKTSTALAMGLAIASGRNFLAGSGADHRRAVQKHVPVLFANWEDDRDQLLRQVHGNIKRYGITKAELDGRFFLYSGAGKSMGLVEMRNGVAVETPYADTIIAECKRVGAGVVFLDPMKGLHNVPENDNSMMDVVMITLTRIAIEANVAVVIVHHAIKRAVAGDGDSWRGGSSQHSRLRVMLTVATMTKEEARDLQIPEAHRFQYIRVDSGKENLSPRDGRALWYRLIGVDLNNANHEYPSQYIQVVETWEPPVHSPLDAETTRDLLRLIDDGPGDGEKYTFAKQGDLWVVPLVMDTLGIPEEAANIHIQQWKKAEVLISVEYISTKRRSSKRQGLRVDWSKVAEVLPDAEEGEAG